MVRGHRLRRLVATVSGFRYVPVDLAVQEMVKHALVRWSTPAIAFEHLQRRDTSQIIVMESLCLLWGLIPPDHELAGVHRLQALLSALPEDHRVALLEGTTQSDEERLADILSRFVMPPPAGLLPLVQALMDAWSKETRSDDLALRFYHALPAYGVAQDEADWLLVRAFIVRHDYHSAEPLVNRIAQHYPTSNVLEHLLLIHVTLQRPARQQLDTLRRFLMVTPLTDANVPRVWGLLGTLYDVMVDDEMATTDALLYLQTLRQLLLLLPEPQRGEMMLVVTRGNDEHTARLLLSFVPQPFPGLVSLVQSLMNRWAAEPRHDRLALQFYASLADYGIADIEREWLLARAFYIRNDYEQAEPLLQQLALSAPTADVCFYLLTTLQILHRPPHMLLEACQKFLHYTPSDNNRTQIVWSLISPIYQQALQNMTPELFSFMQQLRTLLTLVPEQERASRLVTLLGNDEELVASVLIAFSIPELAGLRPLAQNVWQHWSNERRSDDLAIQFYHALEAYGIAQRDTDGMLAEAFVQRHFSVQAVALLERLTHDQATPELLWLLAEIYQTLHCPPLHIVAVLARFLCVAPLYNEHRAQVWAIVGAMHEELLVTKAADYLSLLKRLFECLPTTERADALALITQHDHTHSATLLALLAPSSIDGFAPLAQQLFLQWSHDLRDDDIALKFYEIAPTYGIAQKESHLLWSRALIQRGFHLQALSLLESLVQAYPTDTDILWYLASMYHSSGYALTVQLNVLHTFIVYATPSDEHYGEAWEWIGDAYSLLPHQGMQAIEAYQQAHKTGRVLPKLEAFYAGEWEAIPSLHDHPDYVFPVVVALDLEVNYTQQRIYEVAAIRMKGQMPLRTYEARIQGQLVKPTEHPIPVYELAQVASELRAFLGQAYVVGHNVRDFDVQYLHDDLGISIPTERILDTLFLARLLYPENLHHHLALLCHHFGIENDTWHEALPDAQACARLFHCLGDELMQRGDVFVTGVRALVQPESAFDRAILQPRGVGANPSLFWSFDPHPTEPHMLAMPQERAISQHMREAIHAHDDRMVEVYDPRGTYINALTQQRTLITVASTHKLESLLALRQHEEDVCILPDPHTLLCPHLLRDILLDHTADADERLVLFCLYQASHTRDASLLYPLRLSTEDKALWQLRQKLLSACCATDPFHTESCAAHTSAAQYAQQKHVLLATHLTVIHMGSIPMTAHIIVDNIAELQLHLAEYSAFSVSSDALPWHRLQASEREAFAQLQTRLEACVKQYSTHGMPAYHERLALTSVVHSLTEPLDNKSSSVLALLKRSGSTGKVIAEKIETLCHECKQEPEDADATYAYWLDLWFDDANQEGEQQSRRPVRWTIQGLNADLRQVFHLHYWKPYAHHVVCGAAITTTEHEMAFFERTLGLPKLPVSRESHSGTHANVYIPSPDYDGIPPAGWLRRPFWTKQVAIFLDAVQRQHRGKSIVIALNDRQIATALAASFKDVQDTVKRPVLAPSLGWTTTKIAERLQKNSYAPLAFVPPSARQSQLDMEVDIEVTGPLRFLHQQDPLVAAQMRVFAKRYPAEGAFTTYLLPQALLELKTRLSSPAALHIILDSRLGRRSPEHHSKILFYQDEVTEMLKAYGMSVSSHAALQLSSQWRDNAQERAEMLVRLLEQHGVGTQNEVSDDDLMRVLQTIFGKDTFRPLDTAKDGAKRKTQATQKDVIRAVLRGEDQLVIAATGSGKSLCFQLPAVLLAEGAKSGLPEVTLVISPLIALMSDQVTELRRKGIFSAIMLNSTLSPMQRREYLQGLKRGYYSIVYMAPEQIHSPALRHVLEQREIGLVAIDETHCLSQWGHDFRPEYFVIKDWLERINEKRTFPILALTATARQAYKDKNSDNADGSDKTSTVQDIIKKLELGIAERDAIITSSEREELDVCVEPIPLAIACSCGTKVEFTTSKILCHNCKAEIKKEQQNTQITSDKLNVLVRLLNDDGPKGLRPLWQQQGQRGIIYCAYKKNISDMVAHLRKCCPGLRVGMYHGGMDAATRAAALQCFARDDKDGYDVIVATNAFGMGIDIRRLGFVIHYDIPGTPEAYYQEIGRAGRDPHLFHAEGKHAQCILLYHPADLDKQRYLSQLNAVTQEQMKDVYAYLHKHYASTQEAYVTTEALATYAGVSEEQINVILYYLEYHTQKVIKQGEMTRSICHLKFAPDLEAGNVTLPSNATSSSLLALFRDEHNHDFALSEQEWKAISLQELADALTMSIAVIEQEILKLVQRGIIRYRSDGRLQWTTNAAQAQQVLTNVERDIEKLLNFLKKKYPEKFSRGQAMYEDLYEVCAKQQLTAVPIEHLLNFLAILSHHRGERRLQLFEKFARSASYQQPGKYEIQLHMQQEEKILAVLFGKLHTTVKRLARLPITNEAQPFSIFAVEADSRTTRLEQHHNLLLLSLLGVLTYLPDPVTGSTRHIMLQPSSISPELLKVDLRSLRLKEVYDREKLAWMQRYAETKAEKDGESPHKKLLNDYFAAQEALMQTADVQIRADLTEEQLALLKLETGCHLIEAPAGCGKTTVLGEYIKHLVTRQQVHLEHIVVMTHYNNAVERLKNELKPLLKKGDTLHVSTVNSFGEKIFKKYYALLFREDGKLYYEQEPRHENTQHKTEGVKLEQKYLAQILEDFHREASNDLFLVGTLQQPSAVKEYQESKPLESNLYNLFVRLRKYGIFPSASVTQEVLTNVLGQRREQQYTNFDVYSMYCNFLKIKGGKGYYTFDDQILFALAILQKNPSLAEEYRHQYDYIIVDEVQDFTPAQAGLFRFIRSVQSNMLVFGDRAQNILHDAEEVKQVFNTLEQQDSCSSKKAHTLTTHFRSMQPILNLANAIRSRKQTTTSAQKQQGELPVLLQVNDQTIVGQAAIALKRLQHYTAEERGSVAFIVPDKNKLDPVAAFLRQQQIPCSILKEKSFYELEHVKCLLVYLQLIVQPKSDQDMEYLLCSCLVPYFKEQQMHLLKQIAQQTRCSLFECLQTESLRTKIRLSAQQWQTLQAHLAILTQFRPDSTTKQVFDAIAEIERGPIAEIAEQEYEIADINVVREDLQKMTVARAVDEIKLRISFVDPHHKHEGWYVSTIDYARSEEFDTVVLLKATTYLNSRSILHTVSRDRNRLYVGVSRASKRVFLLVDDNRLRSSFLQSLPTQLYTIEYPG